MNGKKKLKAETAKISLVRPVRGCCLSTRYTLVPPTGKNGKKDFLEFYRFYRGCWQFFDSYHFFPGCWLISRCLPLFLYSKPLALLHQISSTFGSIRILFFSRRGEMNSIIVRLNAFVTITQVGNLLDHGQQ